MKRLGVLHRQLDALLELVDRLGHAADIVPRDIGDLHHHLAHRGWLDSFQRRNEILAADVEIVEHFGRDGPLVEIEPGHDPAHRVDRRLARQRRDIGADEAVRGARQFAKIDLVAQRHAAGVNADDLAAAVLVGDPDHDLAVETAGAAQRLVDRIGAVGGGDHDQIGARLQPVHQRQQLGNEALFSLTRHPVALGSDRIDLVDEDDRRGVAAGLLEDLAQPLLALAIARAHDLGPVDDREIGIALIGDGLR